MWKFQKIVWWAALVWSLMFGWNSMAQVSNTRDVNTTNTEILQKNSSEQLLDVFNVNPENLDREKINNMDIADVPIDVLRYWMLKKMNEIRKEKGLKPLKYDEKLASVAQNFANENLTRSQFKTHKDSQWRWPSDRIYDELWDYVKEIYNNWFVEWVWENIWTVSGYTINSIFSARLHSEWHREALLSKYVNSVWFGINKSHNVIIHTFWNVL